MANFLKWRLDFVKLADEDNPTDGVENGSTLYEVDTGKLYIYYKGTWYEQDAEETPSEEVIENEENK